MTRRYFDTLIVSGGKGRGPKRRLTLPVSIAFHVVVLVAVIVLPLLSQPDLPEPVMSGAIRAYLVEAPPAAPPPPPPPPPPAAAAAPKMEKPKLETPREVTPKELPDFTAPVEVPADIQPTDFVDTGVPGGVPGGEAGGVGGGEEGGVMGGTLGGVPDGVLGGTLGGVPGGVPEAAPPPKPEVPKGPVRVGGQIKAPRKVKNVEPTYPPIAIEARVEGVVIVEATIDASGRVKGVKVLRGHPLLDQAAVAAVRDWAYSPTTLNGTAVPVVMTVTVNFRLPS